MSAILLLLAVVAISLLVTRVATVALRLTGMTQEAARFQARSALTGVGFTTTEAESVVNHPVRRRVIMALMLVGSAGLVTAAATLITGFVQAGGGQALRRSVLLIGGLWMIFLASRSAAVDRVLSALISRVLRRYTDLDARDYAALLHVHEHYSVAELLVEEGGYLADRPLGDIRLRDEGVTVLGVSRRDGTFLGVPDKQTVLQPGDTAILYGHADAIAEVDRRRAGWTGAVAHERAVEQQHERSAAEHAADPAADAAADA